MTPEPRAAPAPSILIVEDDVEAAGLFRHMLHTHHYAVRVAVDVEHAFAILEREMPAALVVDLHLPGEDGLEFLQQLRATSRFDGLPAAMITGDYLIDESVARDLEGLGVKLYFKPLWEEDLLAVVTTLLKPGAGPDVS
ncbi:MAG: response regulator transcription factor [Acidobacteria bacterium]|nr:response regulator transcription factor [Acidobacteriota bacterium]